MWPALFHVNSPLYFQQWNLHEDITFPNSSKDSKFWFFNVGLVWGSTFQLFTIYETDGEIEFSNVSQSRNFSNLKDEPRGRCRGLPLLLMQHPKKTHINFQSRVFVSKNVVNKILKPDQKLLRATLRWDAAICWRDIFLYCPVFNTICDSV